MKMKAQGSAEYLLLLGIVLMIALTVAILLGWFPGTAEEQRMTESRIFWQSQTVAIVDGIASDVDSVHGIYGGSAGDGGTVVLLTVKNTGKYPLELIAFKSNHRFDYGNASKAYGNYFPATPVGAHTYRFFSPDVLARTTYEAYKAPPKGNDTYTYYQDKTTLKPGEKITVGYGIVGSSATLYGGPENIPMCVERTTLYARKYLDYQNFSLYYAVNANGQMVVKREAGPLILPCVPRIDS